jgi:AraC-like DNA-binding protein
MVSINELLKLSKRGLQIKGDSRAEVARRLNRIVKGNGVARLIDFLSLLHYIASEGDYHVLSSLGFTSTLDQQDLSRLNKIFDYLLKNFQKNITLGEMSKIASMSSAAICRYFKDRTNKTFITFLNEIRVGHACKLLIEKKEMNISEICFECGFNNLTNFNIQFKKLKKMPPMLYRETYNSP